MGAAAGWQGLVGCPELLPATPPQASAHSGHPPWAQDRLGMDSHEESEAARWYTPESVGAGRCRCARVAGEAVHPGRRGQAQHGPAALRAQAQQKGASSPAWNWQ